MNGFEQKKTAIIQCVLQIYVVWGGVVSKQSVAPFGQGNVRVKAAGMGAAARRRRRNEAGGGRADVRKPLKTP